MKRLYLETNYIVGRTFDQVTVDPAIPPTAAANGVEVAMPAMCLAEALHTIQYRGEGSKKFGNAVQSKFQELREDQSPTAMKLKTYLNLAVIENGSLIRDREARLPTVLASLIGIRLIELTHQSAIAAVTAPLSPDGPNDNLILYTILDDAKSNPVSDMGFFTRNAKDFGKGAAGTALAAANVTLLSDSSSVISWL